MIKNKSPFRLLVIGSSVLDTIEYDNKVEYKPGGIFYTMLGLSSIKEETENIDLITNIDDNSYQLFEKAFNSANLEYSSRVPEISSVHLRIYKDKERVESFYNKANNLNIPKEVEYKRYEGILINMISGYDIDISQLINIRDKFNGLIYCDIHSLARDFNEKNERVHRIIPCAEEWLSNIDIVQVNEYELFTLFESSIEEEIATKVLQTGVSALIITKGEKGAILYHLSHGEIVSIKIDGVRANATNIVGCGDIFGAVFFYNYIKSHDYQKSLKQANLSAANSTEYSTFEQYKQLKYI